VSPCEKYLQLCYEDSRQYKVFFFFYILSGVRLSLLVLRPLTGLLYQPPDDDDDDDDDDDCGETGGMKTCR
jgi:hypothetical protein